MKKMFLLTLTCGFVVVVMLFAGSAQLAASEKMKPKKDGEMMMKTEGDKMMQEGESMKQQGETMMKEGKSVKQESKKMMKEEPAMKQESESTMKTEPMKSEGEGMMKKTTTME
jgi:hypothetical protein